MDKKKLILVQFNEINIDIFYKEIQKYRYLSQIFNLKKIRTFSESEYDLLEPWIQWVSVYTGKSASEHGIFRLGDFDNKNKQIFEILEEQGFTVGSVCPMNASNNLQNPKFFLPDPWTDTKSDKNFFNQLIYKAISQAVNDNSKQKISLKSFFSLAIAFVFYFSINNLNLYIKLIYKSLFKKHKWCKALFLDLFLSDFFVKKLKKTNPDFSSLFLNACAHIQHHYFFNMIGQNEKNPSWYINKNVNPINDMLATYDKIFQNLIKNKNFKFIICTGLSQIPASKTKYYYRLKNHDEFLRKLNIRFNKVLPRMTRDFTIYFDTNNDLEEAYLILTSIVSGTGIKLFGEIDKREKSLFVTLTFSDEIFKETKFHSINFENLNIFKNVVFVAIKNGIHNSDGYAFLSDEIIDNTKDIHVKDIFKIIKNFFLIKSTIAYDKK